MSLNLADVLAESARRLPHRTAVVCGAVRLSYRELWERSRRWAGALAGLGVRPGGRVAVLLPTAPDFPTAYFAIAASGAAVVPVDALLTPDEIACILTHSRATHLISGGSLWSTAARAAALAGVQLVGTDQARDGDEPQAPSLSGSAVPLPAPVPCAPDDLAAVLYTDSTSGRPKGVMLTHLNLILNAAVVAGDVLGLTPDDTVLGCLPLFDAFGQTCAMNAALRAGSRLVLMPRFDSRQALDLLCDQAVTVFLGVPAMYAGLLDAARDNLRRPQRLRMAVSGGATLPAAVLEQFEQEFGTDIHEGYGLTETSPVATFNQNVFGRRPGTIGHPIWGVRVEIADADVEDAVALLPDGVPGEIVIRGHNVFAGYLDDESATATAIVDGWFRSGDIGVRDEDGFISVIDRKKDL